MANWPKNSVGFWQKSQNPAESLCGSAEVDRRREETRTADRIEVAYQIVHGVLERTVATVHARAH
jgi:hypothetical protein